MPQVITTTDVLQGWFRCSFCEVRLDYFFTTHCSICDHKFTLLQSLREQEEKDSETETPIEK